MLANLQHDRANDSHHFTFEKRRLQLKIKGKDNALRHTIVTYEIIAYLYKNREVA